MDIKCLVAAAAVAIGAGAAAEAATLYSGEIPSDHYITYMGADWAWASPCSADSYSCAAFDISEQSLYGWRLPTTSEIETYILSNFTQFISAFVTGPDEDVWPFPVACAAGWFNASYSHCDLNDARNGFIWGTPSIYGLFDQYGYYDETFVLRTTGLPAVPVPAAGLLLLSGAAALGLMRRRMPRGG
ncbi:MAG: VPLPA-CTERM sorting domain-containing protein [Sphingomonadales bacterium]|nr:VPLPA-CTERM sorting domain-containing protein [Sphingomonadales bacterium]